MRRKRQDTPMECSGDARTPHMCVHDRLLCTTCVLRRHRVSRTPPASVQKAPLRCRADHGCVQDTPHKHAASASTHHMCVSWTHQNVARKHSSSLRRTVDTQLHRRNVKRFRGGLVFQAHRIVYHLALCWRVVKKKKTRAQSSRQVWY